MNAFGVIVNNLVTSGLPILVSFLAYHFTVIPVSPTIIIFGQQHNIDISKTYTYDKINSSTWVEAGLSRILSRDEVRSGYEFLVDVVRVQVGG